MRPAIDQCLLACHLDLFTLASGRPGASSSAGHEVWDLFLRLRLELALIGKLHMLPEIRADACVVAPVADGKRKTAYGQYWQSNKRQSCSLDDGMYMQPRI